MTRLLGPTCTHHARLESVLVEPLAVSDEGHVGPQEKPTRFASCEESGQRSGGLSRREDTCSRTDDDDEVREDARSSWLWESGWLR